MQSKSRFPPARESEASARASRILRWIVVSVALVVVVVVVILYLGYTAGPRWKWVGDADKRFWHYLDLLIVPVVIAGGVAIINWMQTERERKAEATQREHERRAEDASRERELEVESQRAQDEALQAYLDQMSQLLTDKERPLHRSRLGDNLSAVARARTLTVLTRLDASRKRSVLQFLYESGLVIKGHVIVNLWGADLSEAYLRGAYLNAVNMSAAYLSGAYLNAADLRGIDLSEADLSGADLSAANLHEADLRGADLLRADLSAANLTAANLSQADMRRAHLRGATLHETDLSAIDLRRAHLSTANLHTANLSEADLREADLTGTNLRDADLHKAKLSEADMSGADLTNATMPNGQKYEEWLKTPEGQQGLKTYTESRGEIVEEQGSS